VTFVFFGGWIPKFSHSGHGERGVGDTSRLLVFLGLSPGPFCKVLSSFLMIKYMYLRPNPAKLWGEPWLPGMNMQMS
jgi:hypothetical protein